MPSDEFDATFNSIKVQLRLCQGRETARPLVSFNSIKVQLRLPDTVQLGDVRQAFNSIKVQLRPQTSYLCLKMLKLSIP